MASPLKQIAIAKPLDENRHLNMRTWNEKARVSVFDLLSEYPDVSIEAEHLIDIVHDVKVALKSQLIDSLVGLGFPSDLIAKCSDTDKPIALVGKHCSQLRGITIGSSTIQYFRPWSGEGTKESSFDNLLMKMDERSMSNDLANQKSEDVERSFFQEYKPAKDGYSCLRNKRTFINPSLPFMTATPDGLVFSSATKCIGVVEIKDVGVKNIDEYWQRGLKTRSLGVVLRRDFEGGPIIETIRNGHPWISQIYLKMICLKVKKALLVLRVASTWRTIFVEYDAEEGDKICRNSFKLYKEILKEMQIDFPSSGCHINSRKKGRPQKKRWQRAQKKILPKVKRVANLER